MKDNLKLCFRNITALSLIFAILSATSVISLAVPENKSAVGEITVSGNNVDGNGIYVLLNGERAVSGRTFFSSGTIETTENSNATVKLGKAGYLKLNPKTNLTLNFDENHISGVLNAGKVKVFNNAGVEVKIETAGGIIGNETNQSSDFTVNLLTGKTEATSEIGAVYLNNGKTKVPVNTKSQQTNSVGNGYLIPVAIFAGITAAALIYTFTNKEDQVVSPLR